MTESEMTYSFLRKVLTFVLIALSVVLLVMFVGRAIDTLLVIFLGILLGLIFRVARDFIRQKSGLPNSISLVIVVGAFLGIGLGTYYLLKPQVVRQGQMLYD